MGESTRAVPSPESAQPASLCEARSHSRLLIRTSSRIELMRRVRVNLPLTDRRLRPPRSRFSCTYVE